MTISDKSIVERLILKFHEEVEQVHADVLHDQGTFDLLQFLDLRSPFVVSYSSVNKCCQGKTINGAVVHDSLQLDSRSLDLSDIEFHHCGRSQFPAG